MEGENNTHLRKQVTVEMTERLVSVEAEDSCNKGEEGGEGFQGLHHRTVIGENHQEGLYGMNNYIDAFDSVDTSSLTHLSINNVIDNIVDHLL